VLQASDRGDKLITPPRPINQCDLLPSPRNTKKRAFQVVVDDEIEFEEGQIRAQMVRGSCFAAALRRSLRMILSDCR
jgi:hypothetical protein